MSDETQTLSEDGSQKDQDTAGKTEPKHPVDVETQEKAGKERAENGGYD